MLGVYQSEPKFLAVVTSMNARQNARCLSARTEILAIVTNLNARRSSVRTEFPGDIYQFECEAFVGQNQISWQITSLNAMCYSARSKIPGDMDQFK